MLAEGDGCGKVLLFVFLSGRTERGRVPPAVYGFAEKISGAVQLFNSVARTVLAFSRLFDDPGLGDFYGWLYFHF